jgi:hypothetical protein
MFNGHRVVVCVPSGRYRYLRVLLPYLLAERHAHIIDRIDLWVNTDVTTDLDYLARMEERHHPQIVRVPNPGPLNKGLYDPQRDHWQFNDGIFRFYAVCIDASTIYIKLDDDICYVHDDFFAHMLSAVLERESTNFACVGNVFNVPHVTKVLQERGVIGDLLGRSTGDPRCPVACTDGNFAAYIHKQFLDIVDDNAVESLYFPSMQITGRQRIGTMAWTGRSFAQFGGRVGPRDEVELTTRIPESLQKPLWMVGDAVVCHFGFSHQRAVLEDKTNLLKRYLEISIRLNGDTAA